MARKPIPLGAPPPNPPHTLDVGITRTHSGAGSTLPQDRTGSSSVPPPQPHASEAIEQAGPGPSSLPPSPGNSSDSQEADTSTQVPVLPGEAPQKRPRTVLPPPRAALPEPIPPSELLFPDRTSGPVHPPNSAGHFQYEVGENLTARFKIMRKFGEGTFGQVLECWDRRRGEYVALKVIRCVQKYRDAAMVELRVLRTILEHDPGGRWHCVRLLDWFDYRGHVVMVFERLGPSLYDYLRKNDYAAFPLDLVRDTARQLLEALAFLHSLGLVHTDLKPENVLQRGVEVVRASWPSGSRLARRLPATHALCLVDFGSAAWDADAHAHVVSTRHYRAPEVVLGAGWSWPADLWSLGCMVVEMLTGDALFATHENAEHLAMMQAALGTLPRRLVEAGRAPDVARLFKSSVLDWPAVASSKKSVKAVSRTRSLRTLLVSRGDSSMQPHLEIVLDLVQRLLAFQPDERGSAASLLRHPFFSLRL
ncbi:Serine/threonine-protein kinase AFC2 [Auxenochlorella protothecoides]|uniref:Serine/threonine-protein kinase AFC2 n=1 Tax=Auxenochlorella protothecoides TaxID=3075 RepID=A0A087ST00_AUXPR|nr:Serine/threonine-protein kinase AFC2 [Auxenochlorella protothecoides]KFM28854.1 Serine/threonine-protein kinase AFC2 [Auxenochlorella protothecoides]RMZ53621.1 hypothetical protein APUTEX25_003155 [Auxenochlorella protothecoides]|eukprot:RMZ53621.1 hypothetical protein APUTEX25_003155 [Auxenochlorella protothecoides]